MKRIFKYLMMTVLAAGTMFYSCETTELEDLASPNALSADLADACLLYTSPSPRDRQKSRMPSSA